MDTGDLADKMQKNLKSILICVMAAVFLFSRCASEKGTDLRSTEIEQTEPEAVEMQTEDSNIT